MIWCSNLLITWLLWNLLKKIVELQNLIWIFKQTKMKLKEVSVAHSSRACAPPYPEKNEKQVRETLHAYPPFNLPFLLLWGVFAVGQHCSRPLCTICKFTVMGSGVRDVATSGVRADDHIAWSTTFSITRATSCSERRVFDCPSFSSI